MPDIHLIAMDFSSAVKAAAGDRSLYATAVNADTVFPLVGMVAAANAELYRRTRTQPPWLGYLALDPQTNMIVGSCGFKHPCRDGAVEIAYFTFPGHEGQGAGSPETHARLIEQPNDLVSAAGTGLPARIASRAFRRSGERTSLGWSCVSSMRP